MDGAKGTSCKINSPSARSLFLLIHFDPCPKTKRNKKLNLCRAQLRNVSTNGNSPLQASAPLLPFAARDLVVNEIWLWPVGIAVVVFPVVTCYTCFQLLSVSVAVFPTVPGALLERRQVFPLIQQSEIKRVTTQIGPRRSFSIQY